MTQSGFATGAPCWFDVTSPDIPATAAFYSELFGWKADDLGPEAGHYTILSQDGAPVAGIAPPPPPPRRPPPPQWGAEIARPPPPGPGGPPPAAGGAG
uniref:VOC family protein n=1 Tax=Nocardia farcinica TaxID=37329 RepID=UPI00313EB15B